MDDKLSHMTELQQQILEQFNRELGCEIKSFDELETFKNLLPADLLKLQALCLFLEKEFLTCEKAGAYFSACISGAAMIEGFLLMLCWLNKDIVSATNAFKKHAKNKDFDTTWGSLSLETLIEIAEVLKWIPADLVKMELRTAIAASYEEIAISKGLDLETIAKGKAALIAHPAIALFDLMREIRNRLHAGRWIREKRPFNPGPFEEWSHLGVVLIAEIRDCLVIKFTTDIQGAVSHSLAEFRKLIDKLQEAAKTEVTHDRET